MADLPRSLPRRRFLTVLGAGGALAALPDLLVRGGWTQGGSAFGQVAAPPPRPLVRLDPRLWDARFEVTVYGFPSAGDVPALTLVDTPFVLPMATDSLAHQVDPTTLQPELFLDGRRDGGLSQRARLDPKQELGMTFAVLPIPRFSGTSLRWSVSWRAQSWSTRGDEALLAAIPWPREWPEETRSALEPQRGIESDGPAARALVGRAVGDRARQMPPWFAAKEVIRTAILAYNSVRTDAVVRRATGRFVGLDMVGAQQSLTDGTGSSHDMVAACVAALRVLGVPARPVLGIMRSSGLRNTTILTAWAELFLPGAGWIPFDPRGLRGTALRQLRLDQPWRDVATIRDLNERIAVAWCFAPKEWQIPEFASVWGWRPTGQIQSTIFEAAINVQMTNRGRGQPDP